MGFLSEEFAQDEKNLVAIPVNQIATGHVNFRLEPGSEPVPGPEAVFWHLWKIGMEKKELLHA